MSKKLIVAGIIASGLYIISKIFRRKSQDENDLDSENIPIVHKVVVKEINGEWRVVLEGDESKSDVYAKRGDRVIWKVKGSAVTFEFPNSCILGFKSASRKNNVPLDKTILKDSPLGEFAYSVFIKKTGTYARGQSPPRIIVKE